MSADMRKASNKAIARELALHGSLTVLRLENAELKLRIRLAREELMRNWRHGGGSMCSREVADRLPLLLDLRKPLPKARRR